VWSREKNDEDKLGHEIEGRADGRGKDTLPSSIKIKESHSSQRGGKETRHSVAVGRAIFSGKSFLGKRRKTTEGGVKEGKTKSLRETDLCPPGDGGIFPQEENTVKSLGGGLGLEGGYLEKEKKKSPRQKERPRILIKVCFTLDTLSTRKGRIS